MRSILIKGICLLALIAFLPTQAGATEPFAKVGTYALQFLKIPVSARATGMGSAFTAIANDASATYWNPAGLVDMTRTQVSLNHTWWPADIGLSYATAAFNLPFVPGTFGVSARALTLDPQKERTVFLPEGTGRTFDAAVCMHSGLDYILDDADLEMAFRSLRGCLRTGGLLAFDKCLDEPAFYRDDYSNWRRLSCGHAQFEYRWDRTRRLLEQRCTVTRTDGDGPPRTDVVFHLKAVAPDELTAMVLRSGFELVKAPRQFTVPDPGMGIFRAV